MFRIDRNLVNLATSRSVQVDSEESVAAAEVENHNATASAAYIVQESLKAVKTQAETIISDARNEAAALTIAAREEAEEERGRARQEGYQEGYREGRAEGSEEIRKTLGKEYEDKICKDDEMLKHVIDELYTERKTTYDGLEEEIINLTMDIVKKIIYPAEEAIGGIFESIIRNALKQIAPEGKIIIRVSPAEYERFFSSGSVFFELDKGVTVTAAVLRDASLGEFDCVIDTDDETVNAGLDTQLKYIKIAFNRAND